MICPLSRVCLHHLLNVLNISPFFDLQSLGFFSSHFLTCRPNAFILPEPWTPLRVSSCERAHLFLQTPRNLIQSRLQSCLPLVTFDTAKSGVLRPVDTRPPAAIAAHWANWMLRYLACLLPFPPWSPTFKSTTFFEETAPLKRKFTGPVHRDVRLQLGRD